MNPHVDLFHTEQSYTLVAASLALGFLLYLLISTFTAGKNRSPPEASGAWPIVGHFDLFGGSELPHITLASMADKYGPIFTIRLGIRRVVVVNNRDIAKEVFTTHDQIVSDRPKYLASKLLGYNYVMFGTAPYGQYWREMRKIVSLQLLSSRRLDQLKHVRESEIADSIKLIHDHWSEKSNGHGKVLMDMTKWLWELNMNVVLRMVAGKRYSGATNPEEEKEMEKSREFLREFFRCLGLFTVRDTLPFLGWLDLGGHEKFMTKLAKDIDGMAGEWLDEHRRKRRSNSDENKDFMDVMISAVEQGGLTNIHDGDTIIKSACMLLIGGSADTQTTILTWAVALLLNNPHALKKAQEELDKHVGRGRQVEESDVSNLAYLQAIVKETLRLHPPGLLGATREFSQDCTLAGYHIPKGTWLTTNLLKIQRDPEIWSNPEEFMPDRFLDGTHKDLDFKGTAHFELMPFGAGRRSCPGYALGLHMVNTILATLLQNFEISTPNGAPVDMTMSAGLINAKVTPLEVLVSPRL